MHTAQKRTLGMLLKSKITLFILLLLTATFMISFIGRYRAFKDYKEKLTQIENNIDRLSAEKVQLQDLLSLLSSDVATEEQARLKLGWIKEGERAFIVSGNGRDEENSAKEDKESNPKLWFKYFFN